MMFTLPQNSSKASLQIVKDSHKEIQEMLHLQLRGTALRLIQGLFQEEVEAVCGSTYSRKYDSYCHRGGSDPGSVLLSGQRIAVKKPRIKREGKEVELESYSALQEYDVLCERVMKHMLVGVSTRNYEPLLEEIEGGLGLKKSSVSKAFVKGSQEHLNFINGRDLSSYDFACIMVDGIEFAKNMVIVALGITMKGEKLVLGLREGDTENSEVCKDLFRNLIDRGLDDTAQILFIIDGSKALRKAIKKVFGDRATVQRCVRHKERNILGYLNKQYHPEFRRRWKKIHSCFKYEDAFEEHNKLKSWLANINHAAVNSLEEAEMETLTVIKLKSPRLLRKTVLSTNPIESVFSKVREKSRRVKNWKTGRNQISRWTATSLLGAEKCFHKVEGYKHIPIVMEEIRKNMFTKEQKVA